jgi:hypothetical protein
LGTSGLHDMGSISGESKGFWSSHSFLSTGYRSPEQSTLLHCRVQLSGFACCSTTAATFFTFATAYGLDDRGVEVQVAVGSEFSLLHIVQTGLEATQPPIQWVPGARSPGVKRQGREADHSPPASAEIKKMWIYTSTPPYAFMA